MLDDEGDPWPDLWWVVQCVAVGSGQWQWRERGTRASGCDCVMRRMERLGAVLSGLRVGLWAFEAVVDSFRHVLCSVTPSRAWALGPL
jgi:hypothetical protein